MKITDIKGRIWFGPVVRLELPPYLKSHFDLTIMSLLLCILDVILLTLANLMIEMVNIRIAWYFACLGIKPKDLASDANAYFRFLTLWLNSEPCLHLSGQWGFLHWLLWVKNRMWMAICSVSEIVLEWLNCIIVGCFKDIKVTSAPCPVEKTVHLEGI